MSRLPFSLSKLTDDAPRLLVAAALVALSVAALVRGLGDARGLYAVAFGLVAALLVGGVWLSAWPRSALLLLFVAAMLTRYRFDVAGVSVRAEHVAVLLVFTVGGARAFFTLGRVRIPSITWLLAGWLAANGLAAWLGPDPRLGLQNTARLALLVLTFLLVFNLIPDRESWRWAVAAWLVVAALEAAFGIVARALYPLGLNLGVQVGWNFPVPIPYGTFEEGNLFGSHAASWALVGLGVLWLAPRGALTARGRRWLWLGAVIWVTALALSLSRGAWIMFFVGAGLLWVLRGRGGGDKAYRLLLLALALPLIALSLLALAHALPPDSAFAVRLKSFLELERDYTFSARLHDWALAWQDWLARPLIGWGPGSFYSIHGLIRFRPAWISNLSLRLLQESGLVGAGFFLAFLALLAQRVYAVSRRLPPSLDRTLLVALALSYFALLGLAYQSTDGIWLAASWIHAALIAAGARVLSDGA
ncbi:MAG: hypothetical protein GXP42_15345 [Chloroflexi bacterium]|nr:hypothetical protein [Chloroflexota bacterium]